MKKLIILSILALFMLSMSAMATETRTTTIGQNNLVVLDEANIWLFPSRINDYPSLAIGEFSESGGNQFNQFGIHWKFNRENPWVLGTYFDNMTPFEPEDVFGSDLVGWDFSLMENRRLHLFYGRKLSDLYFGTRLSVYNASTKIEADADARTESISYYDLSLGLTEGTGKWDVAANFAIGTWTDEAADGSAETEPDGFMDLGIQGRYFHQLNPSYTLVPHAGVFYSKRGAKYLAAVEADTENYSTNGLGIMVGTGLNYTPATNVFAVADFGLAYMKGSSELTEVGEDAEEYDYSELWLPYFRIGLDADVFKWMDVRLGATSTWLRSTDEFTEGAFNAKTKLNYADNETYLGFGFHFGRLHIDTYTDPDIFLEGFNFISGGEDDMNFRLSVAYEMM